jgi:hypothetical protein
MPGEYKFVFSNIKSKDEKTVLISIHNQDEKESGDDLTKIISSFKTEQDEEVRVLIQDISSELNNISSSTDSMRVQLEMKLHSKK